MVKENIQMERLIKIDEVSAILQISPKTIYNWVHYGYIPYFKVYSAARGHGGLIRFRQSDIEKWLQKRKQNGRESFKYSLAEN